MHNIIIYINLPIVGIVVTTSPNFNLYKMVVFPAASRPTARGRGNCIKINGVQLIAYRKVKDGKICQEWVLI